MRNKIEFKKLITLEEMLPNYDLILGLTPTLNFEQYENYLQQMIPNNYFQVVAINHNKKIVGLSGFWIATKIYCGKYLEIDNFIVDESERGNGIGKELVDWMEEEAKRHECNVIMLDAYVENFKAHAFYYRNGFVARGFHYLKWL